MSRNSNVIQTEPVDLKLQSAVHAFAQALAETGEFLAFEEASERLGHDEVAQKAIQDFQEKQQSLQMLLRLNAVGPVDRAELERLQSAYLSQPSVADCLDAQENLTILCQAAADLLSERIGLSYTAACGPGCC